MHLKAEKRAKKEKQASVQSKSIFHGKVISLRSDTFTIDQTSHQFDVIEHPGAVVMIPIDENGHLIFVKQWRRAAEKILIEFPAGTLEDSEEIEICAQRELQEEIGYKANTLISLGGFYSAPGFCTEYLYLFLALDLEKSQLQGEDTEEIDQISFNLDKALEMIDDKEIIDAKTVAGIYLYQRWLQRTKS